MKARPVKIKELPKQSAIKSVTKLSENKLEKIKCWKNNKILEHWNNFNDLSTTILQNIQLKNMD